VHCVCVCMCERVELALYEADLHMSQERKKSNVYAKQNERTNERPNSTFSLLAFGHCCITL